VTAPYLRPVAPIFALTAGFVDTVGYVGLFGLFTAHVTGNLVVIGASIAHPNAGLIAKLSALPVFVVVVAATSLFIRRCRKADHSPVRRLLAAQAILLAAFMVLALIATPLLSADAPLAVLAGLTGVAAMAIQNAASRTTFVELAPTTVMTGNVTQLVLDLTDLLDGDLDRSEVHARMAKMGPPLLAFAAGAIVGGLAFSRVGFWCLAAPIVLIASMAFRSASLALDSETGASK
jgi:uncharacterized membrane protein YoaK (UPF0700 family)